MEVTISADEFMSVRNGNQNTYKKLCQAFLKVRDSTTQLKVALCILKAPPEEREEFEIAVLEQATKEMEFFKSLHDYRLHQKCCQMMVYRHYNKNDIVFKEGDPSNEFFIIIDGSVNVYVRKKYDRIQEEILQEQNQWAVLTEEEKEHHPRTIVENYQAPRQLQRRMTINLNEDDFAHIASSYKPRPFVFTDRKDVQHKDVDIIRKLTFGLEKLADKQFLFSGGVFLHELVAKLRDGQIFGERGLMIESSRTGTVIANTQLHVAVLTRKDYKMIVEDHQLEKIRKKTKLLGQTILKRLTYKEAIESQYKFEKVHYPIGHYIYKIGETPQQVVVIKKGTVRLYRKTDNKIYPLCELGQDQYFGEIEYFEQCERIHTAQVTSQQFTAYIITYTDLAKLFSMHPQCESQLNQNYLQRGKINNERLKKTLKTHKKYNSQPTMNYPIQGDEEQPKKFSIQEAKKKVGQMEFIKTTQEQLKVMRGMQKQEQRRTRKDSQMSLADTLNHLEVQSQLIRKEIRRREQRRFSSITFDRDQFPSSAQNINQNFSKTPLNKIASFDRGNSLSQQYKYPYAKEIIKQQDVISIDTQKETQTPMNTGILISSKHNLFRAKPTKTFLMNQYQRRQPKTYSSELSIKTYFN